MVQRRTVAGAAACTGIGLHTGAPVTVRVAPAPAGHGIVFVRTDLPGAPRIPADAAHVGREPRRTALEANGAAVHTVEHLLSAAMGLGVDTLRVEIDGPELPGLDGSAADYVALLDRAGLRDLPDERPTLAPAAPVTVEAGGARVTAHPAPGLTVDYLLEYPAPIGRQRLCVACDAASYRAQIAPARTFCLLAEVEALRAAGLGRGADTGNTLVVGPDGVIDNTLRFPDEFVRHKILDLLGDLALLPGALHARVEARRSGHDCNRALVRALAGA